MNDTLLDQWQPIATAPKDGQPILAGYWHEDGRWFCDIYDAEPDSFDASHHGFSRDVAPLTHWMPLPEPPHADRNCCRRAGVMGDLTLPQRLRVLAAITPDGEVEFTLNRDETLDLVRMLEDRQRIRSLIDRAVLILESLNAYDRRAHAVLSRQIWDVSVLTASCVCLVAILMWGAA